jgi:hypothetical protein
MEWELEDSLVNIRRGKGVKYLLLLLLHGRGCTYSSGSLCVTLTIVMCTFLAFADQRNNEGPHSFLM